MNRRGFVVVAVALVAALPISAWASGTPNFAGHYELVGKSTSRTFSMDVKQTGSRVKVTFEATSVTDPNGNPIGKGRGEVNDDGVLEFSFKDSFANEGTATVTPSGNTYRVELRVTKFIDPTPLHFYGVLVVKKIDVAPTTASSG